MAMEACHHIHFVFGDPIDQGVRKSGHPDSTDPTIYNLIPIGMIANDVQCHCNLAQKSGAEARCPLPIVPNRGVDDLRFGFRLNGERTTHPNRA